LTVKAGNGELAVTIAKAAPAARLSQTGLFFEKGKSYQLSFYARSDRNREIKVEAGNRGPGDFSPALGVSQVFQLGAANQPFSFSFTLREETTSNGAGEVGFGFAAATDGAPTTITLSKIALVELNRPVVEFAPLTASELVKNGNFELDASGWTGSAPIRLSLDNGRLKLVVPAAAGQSAAPAVATTGLELKAGSAYLVSLLASADSAKSLVISLKGKQGREYLDAKLATLACTAKEGYWQFYVDAPANDSATLSFQAPMAGTFLLDRISLRATGPWMDSRKPVAERVKLLLAQMNLDEKVGQMVQSERAAAKPGDVKNYGIGSILSGGGSVPPANTPAGWIGIFNRFQSEAMATRLTIPILYGIDAVHGHGNVYGATIFPQNIGLGATRDPGLLEKIGAVTALEVAATGLNWTFGPCVAVSRDERWGRAYESFGESPDLQTLLAGAFVKGLQGSQETADWMKGRHVVGTAKHFMGDGGAEWGTGEGSYTIDRGDIKTLTLDQLKALHGQGYVQAVKQGIGTVMASFNLFKGVHMSVNKTLLSDYLKGPVANGGLGFAGFVIGDWDAFSLVSELEGDYATKVLAAYNAGMDMAMEQSRWSQVIKILRDGVKAGAISQSRIDDAVRRILTVKFNSGAFEKPWALDALADQLGTAANRAVAAQAVRESLVLLKNDQAVLPLRKNAKIYVGGPMADNVGWQCGGWTMQWQGGSDRNGQRLTPGSTILDGMKALAKANGGEIITDIGRAAGCDVAVVVVGETPYAEGVGDITTYGKMTLDDGKVASGNLEAIKAAQALKIPVVVIVVSGRPLIITQEVAGWNALVAAWLPGSEGAAVADVLYGLVNFKGLLPVTWPKTLDQLPINVGDINYDKKDPLFPYGYGLKYPENMRN